jgi:hypothetical protein
VVEDECEFNAETGLVECPQLISTTFIGTHIGRSSNSSSGFAFLNFDPAAACPKDELLGVPFVTEQAGVIVAANGDELNFETVTEDCFLAGVEATYEGTWTIDGGTGRFVDAQGAGNLAATVYLQTISTEWTDGTISY